MRLICSVPINIVSRDGTQPVLCSAQACYIEQILRRNQAPTIPFNVNAFRTAFPPPSLLKYTNTSLPMPCHSRTRSAHQRRSSSLYEPAYKWWWSGP
jgi:hypothetical protein